MDTAGLHPDLLRAFVTVVEVGGFARAAERLRRGQSAISLQIKRLEDQLGVRLLDRGPRHLQLTPQGEAILDHARRILALSEALVARAQERELSGVVRLGAPEDFATSHLPRVLARFARSHPRVALEVTCELTLDLLERFSAGGLDLALVKREAATGPALHPVPEAGRRVWREPLVWVGAAATAERLVAGEALPLVVSPRPCVYRQRATDALDGLGRPWRVVYTCGSLAGTHAAVRAGLGVTILPREMVPSDLSVLRDPALGLPPLADTEMALIEAPHLPPAALRLRETIIQALEQPPPVAGAGAIPVTGAAAP